MADNSRQAVYNGEFALRDLLDHANEVGSSRMVEIGGSKIVLPVERKFASLETIQVYCDLVLKLVDHTVPVKVRKRKGLRLAHYDHRGVIAIPIGESGWALREIVVLHELAHHIAYEKEDGHGPLWRKHYLNLLEVCMSPEVAFALQVCWDMEGVR